MAKLWMSELQKPLSLLTQNSTRVLASTVSHRKPTFKTFVFWHRFYLPGECRAQPITRCSRRRQTSPSVSPPWRAQQNIRVISDSAHSLCCVRTWRNPQNRKYITYCIAVRGDRTESRPQTTCTENSEKFGRVIFEICERTDEQTNKQTDRHTDALIAILCTPTGGEVMIW